MASRLFLSNDSVTGNKFHEQTFVVHPFVNVTSALTGSATGTVAFVAPANGKIVDFYFGVGQVALSASGFVSADISCNVRINSASCLSTLPSLTGPVATSALCVTQATNKTSAANLTSAVVNAASAVFSAGDIITIDHNARSAGSAAAAGAAGNGLSVGIVVRYEAS